MAHRYQVADAHLRAAHGVDRNRTQSDSPWDSVEADDRDAGSHGVCNVLRVSVTGRNHQQNTVHAAIAQDRHHPLFALDLMIRIGRDEQITVFDGRILGAADHAREVRIGDIGDHHAQKMRLLCFETACDLIRVVVERFHRPVHPVAYCRVDAGRPTENVGNRSHGYLRFTRNLLDGGHCSQLITRRPGFRKCIIHQ